MKTRKSVDTNCQFSGSRSIAASNSLILTLQEPNQKQPTNIITKSTKIQNSIYNKLEHELHHYICLPFPIAPQDAYRT